MSELYFQHRAQRCEAGGSAVHFHKLGKTRITQNIDLGWIITINPILGWVLVLDTFKISTEIMGQLPESCIH